ncbi:hypothetical protein ACJX0J_032972, partial [Zea mays]
AHVVASLWLRMHIDIHVLIFYWCLTSNPLHVVRYKDNYGAARVKLFAYDKKYNMFAFDIVDEHHMFSIFLSPLIAMINVIFFICETISIDHSICCPQSFSEHLWKEDFWILFIVAICQLANGSKVLYQILMQAPQVQYMLYLTSYLHNNKNQERNDIEQAFGRASTMISKNDLIEHIWQKFIFISDIFDIKDYSS